MKFIIAFLMLCGCVMAQTNLRTVMVDTNGVMQRPTNLTITNSIEFNASSASLTRSNLQIKNTFAGQFSADFYDDFSRYSNGTTFTNGFIPLAGSPYRLTILNTNFTAPSITNGALRSTNGGIWYLTSDLLRPVYNFGGEVSFSDNSGNNRAVIILNGDTNVFGKMLHINFSPVNLEVDVATNGIAGFGGTNAGGFSNTVINTNWGAGIQALPPNKRHFVLGQVDGDTLHLKINDRLFSVYHPDISEVTGPHMTIESFYSATNSTNFWHKAWANSSAMQQVTAQPLSEYARNFNKGNAIIENYLLVSTNAAEDAVSFLSSTNRAFIRGGLHIAGNLAREVAGFNIQPVPAIASAGGNGSNTNTTNLTTFYTAFLPYSTMQREWTRIKYTFFGSFANNTNSKRVTFVMAGGTQLDTGLITNSGEWSVETTIYRTPTNTHEAFAVFVSENFTKTARWTFNFADTFIVDLKGAATSNNEVIMRGAWADWYP